VKIISRGAIALLMILLSAPLISAQDLSRYRTFSLGTSLAELSKQLVSKQHETNVEPTLIHQRPAVIQEVTLWLLGSYQESGKAGGPGFADTIQLLQRNALQDFSDL